MSFKSVAQELLAKAATGYDYEPYIQKLLASCSPAQFDFITNGAKRKAVCCSRRARSSHNL